MKEIIDTFVNNSTDFLTSYGPLAGVLLIMLESIIPALPLSVFIALNIVAFGDIVGFLISWLSTVVGCMISFWFFRHFFRDKLEKFIKKKDMKKFDKVMQSINNISFSNLVILIATPFSPAFLINIAGGLSKIKTETFFMAILIGKMIMVYFWGYVGKSLLESLTDINVLFKISFLLIGAYLISKIVEKKLNVD